MTNDPGTVGRPVGQVPGSITGYPMPALTTDSVREPFDTDSDRFVALDAGTAVDGRGRETDDPRCAASRPRRRGPEATAGRPGEPPAGSDGGPEHVGEVTG
jgi:hypothetical protein